MEAILEYDFLGKPAELWFAALAYSIGGLVVGLLVSWVSKNTLRRVFSKTKTRMDDILLASIAKPLIAVIVLIGIRMGIDVLTLEPGVAPWINKAITILITCAVAWALAKLLDGLIEEYLVPYVRKTEGNLDDQLLPLIRNVMNVLIWIIAMLFAIREAGYDIGALLAGLGIGGVAIALAAKDTLSNFFGSVAVFIDKPFMINDRIKVGGYDGNIIEIGIRTSRLRTLDNRIVTLPNSMFTAGAIENVSSEPSTKVPYVLELDRSIGHEGVERAISILRKVAADAPGLDAGTVAALTGLGQTGFNVTFIVFLRKDADYFGSLSALNLEILRRFSLEGIEFARPTRVVVDERAKARGGFISRS
jgi:MscS family membrane protein